MSMRRREFLKLGGVLACAGGTRVFARQARGEAAVAAPAESPEGAPKSKRLALRNLHTGEDLEIDYCCGGAYIPEAMAQIEHILRDFRSGELHAIDPGLMDRLYDVATALRVNPVFGVISGYRSSQTNEQLRRHSSGVALRSLHVEGRAIDVRLAGVDCANLAAGARVLGCGGVGYYRSSDFVHLDTGAFRTWRG
jgi:uncharacterized protein YcbK (DUF882 family)